MNNTTVLYEGLLNSEAVRERCSEIGRMADSGETRWFSIDREQFKPCVQHVIDECLTNYPDLDIPYHSRWRHFVVEGVDLWEHYANMRLSGVDQDERTRIAIDLVFISVLLDAGAGAEWQFVDPVTHATLCRSEGLAAASIDLFFNHLCSNNTYQVNTETLSSLTLNTLANAFQYSDANRLIGLEGRYQLLINLGKLLNDLERFGISRPGHLYDLLKQKEGDRTIEASQILVSILKYFNSMWPSGLKRDDFSLGDCGVHSQLQTDDETTNLVPFHKLSQWLSYSLVEPLEWSGLTVSHLNQLTGLPEYRNGGLLIDSGVLRPMNQELLKKELAVESEAVVEWRALTVYLLDKIGDAVRTQLKKSPEELPLASILQGGTWAAGRRVANQLRSDGSPPILLAIDGTVF